MSKRIAVFPGSFDPITKGHEEIIKRGLPLFDELIIGIGYNTNKHYFFSQDRREHFISKTFEGESKIKVVRYSGLTVEFCKQIGASRCHIFLQLSCVTFFYIRVMFRRLCRSRCWGRTGFLPGLN